ncbi:TonB-dependent receptor [Sphingomonas abietis]|uniref:TonB-dependent receptor n=1 Tax=Sphingomonas abietis TaxID=3012344 RepID=A0ABY7NNN5_9SPHN|nr:TonB-dependent receptor [Sphingomonas abietis]WBO23142.1 TonB-dependent receptor [Sphingomonas abietis]
MVDKKRNAVLILLAGASLATIALPGMAAAQDAQSGATAPSGNAAPSADTTTDPGAIEAIVVTGVRASLQSAENIKRNSPQIVDSIVAEDIGKLPDRNVAEALQRIPGIQVNRSYGEGTSVAIRGLTQTRTELNGRDIFTAGDGGGDGTNTPGTLSLGDIPSELLAGIDVYKNPSADLIEDQLSGTIDLRTRKPFDFDGFKIAATASNTYSDLVRHSRPSGSVLISDRWDTGIGEIGVLVDVAYQTSEFRQDTISTEPFYPLDQSLNADGTYHSPTDAAIAAELGRTGQATSLPHGSGIGEVYGNRRRFGTDVALQWKPTDTLELTGEVFRSDYKFRFDDYSYFAYTGGASIQPAAGAPFTFANSGDFVSGTFQNVPIGVNTSLDTRHSVTTDYSLHAKWKPTSQLTVTGDLQYVDASTHDLRSIVGLNGADSTLYQDLSGSTPVLHITTPLGLTSPANYVSAFYLDDLNRSKASDKTARLDAEYKFDGGLIQSIKAGFRIADRKNRTDDTGYRYTGLADVPSNLQYTNLGNFFRGQADLFGDALFYNRNTILSYDATRADLGIDSEPTYVPSGTSRESLKTYAGYVAAFFKADALPVPIDGNIGLRVVRTEQSASGYTQIVPLVLGDNGQEQSGAAIATLTDVSQAYTKFLPSLNLRGHLTDNLQLRFAVSKNISRPNLSQLNPAVTYTQPGTAQANQEHDTSGGNPDLKPMSSWNFDVSLEWYFSHTGSLTAAGFYKNIKNYIQTAINQRDISFPGASEPVTFYTTTYDNVATAKVKGFELAYQQFFDFLPGPLSGLGMQANFTYVDSSAPGPATQGGPITTVPLEQLSRYNYNLVGIYEKGKLSARVAYNWRSKYVVTTQGNGTGDRPIFDKPFGELDASISYDVTPHFSLTLEGANLNDAIHSTYFGTTTEPRDVIMNDRRITGVAKITF